MTPKISVVLTTYNRKKRLKKAVKSVLKQTFTEFELIIVNDGSDDGTKEYLDKFKKKDKRITVINRKKNYGQHTKPKNEGTMIARADLIAYLDDDNEYERDHLQALYNEIMRTPGIDGVYGDRMVINEKTGKKGPGVNSDFMAARLMMHNYIDTSDVLIRKSAIEYVGGWDESLPKFADWNLWIRMAKANFKFKRVPLILTRYYSHEGSNQLKSEGVPFDRDRLRIWPIKTSYGEEPQPKIAIFTLTKDRWDYTQIMLESLKENAGYDYDHFIIDNGSTDDTLENLKKYKKQIKKIIKNKKNVGISKGSNQALDAIFEEGGYDLIIKLDNDCELLTPDALKKVADSWGYTRQVIMSPYIEGLKGNTGGGRRIKLSAQDSEYVPLGDEMIQWAEHVGGIFCIAPAYVYKHFRWSEKDFLHGMQDVDFSMHCLRNHLALAYFIDIRAQHIDGTAGQEEKYPEYFELRKEEKTSRHES